MYQYFQPTFCTYIIQHFYLPYFHIFQKAIGKTGQLDANFIKFVQFLDFFHAGQSVTKCLKIQRKINKFVLFLKLSVEHSIGFSIESSVGFSVEFSIGFPVSFTIDFSIGFPVGFPVSFAIDFSVVVSLFTLRLIFLVIFSLSETTVKHLLTI